MKNNNTVLKKEIKDEVVLVLERRLDEKLDILNEKQKDLDEKMKYPEYWYFLFLNNYADTTGLTNRQVKIPIL